MGFAASYGTIDDEGVEGGVAWILCDSLSYGLDETVEVAFYKVVEAVGRVEAHGLEMRIVGCSGAFPFPLSYRFALPSWAGGLVCVWHFLLLVRLLCLR